MNGWMHVWSDGWMTGWMDGWADGCMDGWMVAEWGCGGVGSWRSGEPSWQAVMKSQYSEAGQKFMHSAGQ